MGYLNNDEVENNGVHPQPPVILLRGLLREKRHWGDFTGIAKQYFYDREFICLDIPGNGLLNTETSPDTIQAMRKSLQRQLKTFVPAHQVIDIVSLSMGGMVATEWATAEPKKVRSLVLINSSLKGITPFYKRLRWQKYPLIFKALFSKSAAREQLIYQLTSNIHAQQSVDLSSALLRSWLLFAQSQPVSIYNAYQQLKAAARFTLVNKPNCPMLILSSKLDQLVDQQCSLDLAKAWQTKHIQHESAGHDLPLDDPKWLCEQLSEFWLYVNVD
ncbi:alpha/beta fold hydrolase [Algibacillus agarilyticus]|uniref:alpha/beta fold hydrolase n=1 Tax=Algibacillus agarilyticus TaxID=2234133 RepID=UPI000DCFDF93|nr:alpha/beta hydrolase [Algibacillus agarilyticus]